MKWRVDHPKRFQKSIWIPVLQLSECVRYVKYIESRYILLLTTFVYIQIVNIHGTSIHCKAVQPMANFEATSEAFLGGTEP